MPMTMSFFNWGGVPTVELTPQVKQKIVHLENVMLARALLVEADAEEQQQNTVEFWAPLMKFTFVPIRQSAAAQQL